MSVKLSDGHLIMTFSRRGLNFLKLLLAASSILLIAYFLFLRDETHDYHQLYRVAVSGKKAAWVEAALKTEIDGPYDNSTLVTLCNSKEWIDGLIFKCDIPAGGVVNARNVILNCVRYAIEAGATSFIIPEIFARGTSASSPKGTTIVPFTHFFDLDFFTSSLSTACPRLTLIAHQNDLYNVPSTAKSIPLNVSLLTKSSKTAISDNSIIADPSKWHPSFLKFLNNTLTTLSRGPITSLPARPILITLAPPPLLQFPLSYDPPTFVSTFGRIVRPNPSIRHLASSVLFSLDQSYSLGLQPGIVGIHANKFYGADMRKTNKETKGYEAQSRYHLASCSQYGLKVVYLAAGEADHERFKEGTGNKSISVTNRMELLGRNGFEKELEEMKRLTEDQQGLIDYEVLLHSSIFGGTFYSSSSWNAAMRRHVVVSNGSWIPLHSSTTTSHPRRDAGELSAGRGKRDVKAVPIGDHGNSNEQSFKDDVSVLLSAVGTDKISVFEESLWP